MTTRWAIQLVYQMAFLLTVLLEQRSLPIFWYLLHLIQKEVGGGTYLWYLNGGNYDLYVRKQAYHFSGPVKLNELLITIDTNLRNSIDGSRHFAEIISLRDQEVNFATTLLQANCRGNESLSLRKSLFVTELFLYTSTLDIKAHTHLFIP